MLPFSKYTGCGNDFILIDQRDRSINDLPALVPHLCDRRYGVGGDGVVSVERSARADYRMRIFNSDGSEAEMCGNGLRCLIRFVHDTGDGRSSWKIETKERLLRGALDGDAVEIEMGPVEVMESSGRITVGGREFEYAFLNTGVPHIVLNVSGIENFDLEKWGPLLRHDARFGPAGTNVNIAETVGDCVKVRTFERGVEGETLACGTGAAAAALAMHRWYGVVSPVEVEVKSRERLKIRFDSRNGIPKNLHLSGPATALFDGQFRLNSIQ